MRVIKDIKLRFCDSLILGILWNMYIPVSNCIKLIPHPGHVIKEHVAS